MAQKTRKVKVADTPRTKVRRKKGVTVEPIQMLRLMEAVGPSQAARDLGVSTTLLHNAKRDGYVSKSVEIAAAAVLRDVVGELSELSQHIPVTGPQPPQSVTAQPIGEQRHETAESSMFLIEVPADKAAVVRKVVEMAHGKLLEP